MRRLFVYLGVGAVLAVGGAGLASAQTAVSAPSIDVQDPAVQAEIDALNQTIGQRKTQLDDLHRQIDAYQRQIDQKETRQESLQNELDLLSARMQQTQLAIQANQAQTDQANANLDILDKQIGDVQRQLARQRELIGGLLQGMDATDRQFTLQNLLSQTSFHDLFDRLEGIENVNQDLLKAVQEAEAAKRHISQAATDEQAKRVQLAALADDLAHARGILQDEAAAKQQLIDDTRSSESRFQSLVADLRKEQAQTQNDVQDLQSELEGKLRQKNPAATAQLAWPADPVRGLSTLFHDPTYPFNNLFPHTGIDIPEPQGTPVHAAAAGYVAWVRSGPLYGNYVMIVHADGVATLYAHLSRPLVRQNQYVDQGDEIALSGGLAGAPGSGFSTGPHLHFEVRRDGIPVDPLAYLPPRP